MAKNITPSGKIPDENAYILNLQQVGGYLDGEALVGVGGRNLAANPSACAHVVNHSSSSHLNNVIVEDFHWNDFIVNDDRNDQHGNDAFWSIPNERRQDGSPWYIMDEETIVSFVENNGDACCDGVYGAVFIASRDISKGEELFLNYQLNRPYPTWARDWYTTD